MPPPRQIIALGGGGFLMEPDNPLLDDYILKAAGKEHPKICFIPTASGDAQANIDNFYAAFKPKPCVPAHLSLFRGETAQIEALILAQDILYVGGGNTRNLLVLWKEWGVDLAIRQAYAQGTVLSGVSAGSICWFEQGLTDSVPNELTAINAFGILSGSNCPHFDGEAQRRPAFKALIQSGQLQDGIGTDDGCALHYVDEKLSTIVASRPEAKAYSIFRQAGEIREKVLTTHYLG